MWPTEDGYEPRIVSLITWAAWAAMLLSACLIALLSANPSHATFPGSNGKIVFERDLFTDGNLNPEIFVMDADGGNPVNLTNNPAYDTAPAWSPDGRKIAFARDSDIYVMDADGTNVIRLTNDQSFDFAPAWSPDGSQIVFGSNYRRSSSGIPSSGIFIFKCASGAIRSLIEHPLFGYDGPDWSPDGTRIAFGEPHIWVINQDGSGLLQLTKADPTDIISKGGPSWSPDSSQIAFLGGDAAGSNHDVHIMDSAGGSQINITNTGAEEAGVAWSTDGTRLVFVRFVEGTSDSDVYTMDADGKNVTRIADDPDANHHPDWQPLGVPPLPPCAPPASSLPVGGGPPGTGPALPRAVALLLLPVAVLLIITGVRLLRAKG